MPTYEYKCRECGKSFTKVLTISEHDKRKPACPKCKSKKVDQKISSFFAKTASKS